METLLKTVKTGRRGHRVDHFPRRETDQALVMQTKIEDLIYPEFYN